MIRTSHTHPIQISELSVGMAGGAIGVTFAPGKKQKSAMTGAWSRDLDTDLKAIRDWSATVLVSLIEPWEFDELCIAQLPDRATAHGIRWFGLPITDGFAPDARLLDQWPKVGNELAQKLLSGARIVVHCKGGLGRAGTVACMLLLDTGSVNTAAEAIAMVRSVRPGAVETRAQEEFLRSWAIGST